jgi:hypothetical protein
MRKEIIAAMLAVLAVGSIALVPSFANADTQTSKTWVQLRGFVNQWGNDTVFGWLKANARIWNDNGTIHQWATVDAMWSSEPHRLNVTDDHPGNFTFSFYTARLANLTLVALNYTGYDFYVSGLWNVTKITTTITLNVHFNNETHFEDHSELMNITRTVEPIVTLAPGELHTNGMRFGLDITGIDSLSGFIQDLVSVARRYNTVPGMRDYNFNMDFNMEGRVNIADLTTIAANIDS